VTVADLLVARADDDHPGLLFEDRSWSWRQVVEESRRRAALLSSKRGDGPFHVGVLLDNGPEYLFLLGGAALVGATIVGVNPTRRGPELARDVAHTDCQFVVTDEPGLETLRKAGVDTPVFLAADLPDYDRIAAKKGQAEPATQFLLLFTSGSTGAPKAVRCSQGRLAAIGERAAELYQFKRDDVCYCAMPLFHGNAIMAVWAPALSVGATFATRPKFSASGFLHDVRRFRATFFNYVGKSLSYILATPEQPDDADNTLERGFGTEASERDIDEFQRRFGCRIVEGYGMSEGGAVIRRVPDMPKCALALPRNDTTFILLGAAQEVGFGLDGGEGGRPFGPVAGDAEGAQGVGHGDDDRRPEVAGAGDEIVPDGQAGREGLLVDLDAEEAEEVVDVVRRGHD